MRQLVNIATSGSLAVVRGWQAQKLCLAAGIRPVYLGTVQGWTFDLDKLPNYIAYLQYRSVGYLLEDVAPAHVTPAADATPEAELDLFGGGGDA